MEATRSMLHDQDLPMHLWEKATRTMVYVQNRTPHRVLLQLQLFSQIFEILDPPFYFILPGSVWIPELCFLCYKFGFLG